MSRFGGLIGRKAIVESPVGETKPAPTPEPDENILELDPELFSPIASQVGKENEEVRNLLIDAEYRVSELDAIKNPSPSWSSRSVRHCAPSRSRKASGSACRPCSTRRASPMASCATR